MAPMFAKAAGQLEPDVRLLKLNADEAPSVSARYGIRSIPTMLLLRSGRLVGQVSGAMDSDRIVAWTRAQLATAGAG
jgi:thioredoxin 2